MPSACQCNSSTFSALSEVTFFTQRSLMSLLQWPFPQYEKHTAQFTDIFSHKMENDAVWMHSCRSEVQSSNILLFSKFPVFLGSMHLCKKKKKSKRSMFAYRIFCVNSNTNCRNRWCVVLWRKISKISYKKRLTFQSAMLL